MIAIDRTRLETALGARSLSRFIDRLVRRLERGEPLAGRLTLSAVTDDERRAIDRLLERTASIGRSISIDLDDLAARLRSARVAPSLEAAVEALRGPIPDRRAIAETTATRQTELRQRLAAAWQHHPAAESLHAFLEDPSVQPLLHRTLIGHPELEATFTRVVDSLPASGALLAEFASRTAGDSHALDPGQPLHAIAIRAAAAIANSDRPRTNLARRELWDSLGVTLDILSTPVLVLGLRATDDSFTAEQLRHHATHHEPARLSLRQLRRDAASLTFPPDPVTIVENPNIIAAAADRLPRSRPLICIEGQPKTPARVLLHLLVDQSIPLRYHGDFDWPGLRITTLMQREFGATPWRMTRADYERTPGTTPLRGTPIPTPWDPDLTIALQHRGVAVHEEAQLDDLLPDLA